MPTNAIARLRKLCLSLPESREAKTWDHINFRVADKIFAIVAGEKADDVLCVKVGKPKQKELIRDKRFTIAPYVGRFGWVNLTLTRPNWDEITALVLLSYRLIAPKRLVRELER